MKNIKFITVVFLAIFAASCEDDFLSPLPTSAISADGFYNNEEELEAGVINMYDGLQGVNDTDSDSNHSTQIEFYLTEMRSDNTRTKSGEGEAAQFETYTVQSTNGIVADYYRSMYNVIYRANTVLENIDAATTKKAQFEGEAKFVRAYAYFNLVRLFGDVPLIDRVIAPLETDVSFTRVPTADVYSLIISDLTTAINGLTDGSKNRASKAAAEGLLAKVYLTTGNYSGAQTLCESIMQPSRGFSLEADYKDIFYTEGNDEVIFAIGYNGNAVNDSQNFSAEWLNSVGRTSGMNYVTADVRNAFATYGGVERSKYAFRQDAGQTTQYQVVKYLPNGDASLGIDPTSTDPTLAGNDWIVLRYADVVLMHVESILAGGASTTSTNAIASFKLIRDRAGLTTPAIITKEDLLNERRVELAFENQRFFDLVRFGEAQSILSAFSAANGYSFSGTDLLLPIPNSEIGLSNGVLKQNPGYNN
ncbi:carbohydrate-binding protein SusD [Wenyingzhuangia fucanilytica]|uniref:Carbohydrate-binding protein SusD n=1 Tax=Wenyingzhuangia fucanilytica TaxID=1790137 RepID=A0A1B1Y7Q4_9FLAO|nr:RagB/SusD family nutrient uptake outer membrane protein [Wenyingzhuangia fucanilytica]ANW96811.1 carbohydrate-binding protein SusD [Wenyingzhuangia fucanilytica]